jgi:hypothetical protein
MLASGTTSVSLPPTVGEAAGKPQVGVLGQVVTLILLDGGQPQPLGEAEVYPGHSVWGSVPFQRLGLLTTASCLSGIKMPNAPAGT